jgi:hypothetical protein
MKLFGYVYGVVESVHPHARTKPSEQIMDRFVHNTSSNQSRNARSERFFDFEPKTMAMRVSVGLRSSRHFRKNFALVTSSAASTASAASIAATASVAPSAANISSTRLWRIRKINKYQTLCWRRFRLRGSEFAHFGWRNPVRSTLQNCRLKRDGMQK